MAAILLISRVQMLPNGGCLKFGRGEQFTIPKVTAARADMPKQFKFTGLFTQPLPLSRPSWLCLG